jgi:formylglycine-generating enzyme required for sulfatase activity
MKRLMYAACAFLFLAGCKPAVSVTIVSPLNGTRFEPGSEVDFVGSADHGGLTGDLLVWPSNIDGEIGRGETFSRGDLSEGTHVITLRATSPGGERGEDTITVTVAQGPLVASTTTMTSATVTGDMALIPAGDFEMGCQDGKCEDDELPVHKVYVDAFYIDRYEVRNSQYAEFLNAHGDDCGGYTCYREEFLESGIHRVRGDWTADLTVADYPAYHVTWYGAREYCKSVRKRLPTEAEWEKAARGGLEGKRYPWGDGEPDCGNADFYYDPSGYPGGSCGGAGPRPVGRSLPNDYGLYDMAGNVSEWVGDWHEDYYYTVSPCKNPTGPESGYAKTRRGGGWSSLPGHLRCASRSHELPDLRYQRGGRYLGFRCAVGVP